MAIKSTMTWEEFLAAGEEGQLWEWVDGEVEFISPASLRHEQFLMFLIESLARLCRAHPEWTSFASNGVFTMTSGDCRMPDASLVRKERFLRGQIPVRAEFAPDVAPSGAPLSSYSDPFSVGLR